MSLVPRRIVLLSIVAVSLSGCGRYTRHIHDFSAEEIEVASGIRISVETSGFSTTNSDGSETAGPTYLIAVRVYGTGSTVALSNVKIVDPETGSEVSVDKWRPAVRDPSDAAMLLVDRSGVLLSPSSKEITGELRVGEGESVNIYSFSGELNYEYREEQRSRLRDAINSA